MNTKRIPCADDSADALELRPAAGQLDVTSVCPYVALTPATAREAAAYLLAWAEETEPTR